MANTTKQKSCTTNNTFNVLFDASTIDDISVIYANTKYVPDDCTTNPIRQRSKSIYTNPL